MNTRLYDVFISGPIYILISTYINDNNSNNNSNNNNKFLKYFMLITGVLNILYNGHNYLYFNYKYPLNPLFDKFVDRKSGKTQIHRLYNLLIMYPIFLYVYWYIKLPKLLSKIFLFMIIIGFSFNLYNFVMLL